MPADIYEQHDKAFRDVSAFVILKDGERVATVALKFPKDGAGRLWAYVHWLGLPMVRGYAGGFGYDKRSAAVASAIRHIADAEAEGHRYAAPEEKALRAAFTGALEGDSGHDWACRLERAGFAVLQAV
ncbi:hypothetical protein [Xanthobacter aminoxidans]|uniref:hypothetical protein n=1 Tax=Xanthobacter aminoxidans TaxID=186280 RepID=UPI00202309E3|nr:hypothetical protein [Xanthobacter aminoxidans]MCL8384174.1 hypothetical protein [Xanthobacter aminoxidans]